MKQHKHAELIKAWADGAEIECYCRFTSKWFYKPSPQWTTSLEYRVKPVKKWTPKHTLLASDYIYVNSSYSNYKDVSDDVKNYWKLTKFVEEFEQDWDNQCCEVFKSSITNEFTVLNMNDETNPSLGTIVMSKKCAKKLCKMLNSGEVEL